jgi:hypothetical protein
MVHGNGCSAQQTFHSLFRCGIKYHRAYQIDDEEDSKSQKLGKSVMNALIIVGFIALVTFALVFLYWMGCTKVCVSKCRYCHSDLCVQSDGGSGSVYEMCDLSCR